MFARSLISFLLLGLSLSGANANPASKLKEVTPSFQPRAVQVTVTNKSTKKPRAIGKDVAVASSMMLAFNSGYINGACLSGGVVGGVAKQAVSACTGAWTTSALGFASGDTSAFSKQTRAILSYLGGSAIAGFMNPKPTAFQLCDNTGPTFLLGAAMLFGASKIAAKDPGNFGVFVLALMANGLQNSLTSVHTGNLCRTAHFSGCTSDMGTFLGQCLRGDKTNLYKLKVFMGLAMSFWLGGVTSYYVTQEMTSGSLLFSAFLYLLIGSGLVVKA